MSKIRNSHLLLLVALWLLVHLLVFLHSGIRDDLFDSKGYIESARYFLDHGSFQVVYQLFYTFPILLIAFFLWVFGDGVFAFIIFQCVFSAVAALALYRSATTLYGSSTAGLFATVIFLCWWDAIQWNTAVMTESIALSVLCLVISKIAHFTHTMRNYLIFILLLLLSLLTRPTGVLIVMGAIAFLLTWFWNVPGQRRLFGAIALTSGVIIVLLANIMFSYWDFSEQYEKGNIVTYMDHIEGQPLYSDGLRLDTSNLAVPDHEHTPLRRMAFFVLYNPAHFAGAFMLKVGYLVSGIRPYFSAIHNLYSLAWLSLIYVLFYFGFRPMSNRPVKNFILTVIAANCFLVGISTVDWDNRFYLPMLPGIALLAGGGAAHLFKLRKRLA